MFPIKTIEAMIAALRALWPGHEIALDFSREHGERVLVVTIRDTRG